MSGGSVTGNQFLDTGLMIAAGVAAPELALAVAPEMMATAGGAALATGIAGAGTSALAAGITGQDVGKAALMGGVAGGLGGYMGGAATPGMDSATQTATEIGAQNVGTEAAKNAALQDPSFLTNPANFQEGATSVFNQGAISPSQLGTMNLGADANTAYGQAYGDVYKNVLNNTAPSLTQSTMIPGISKAGMYGAGILGANELLKPPQVTMPQSTTGGVPDALKYSFDRNTYQPATAPYYGGIASNYPQTPYAQRIQGYADGGEIGTVEEMSRQNSLGNNQMFPQSGLGGLTGANTYQNATNTPTPNNVLEPTDAVTDPYTGAMKMARGGIASPTAGTYQNTSLNLPAVKEYMAAATTPAGLKQLQIAAQNGDYNAQFALNNLQGNQVQGMDSESQMPEQAAAQGGIMGYASGGLGSYSDGGQMLKGPGDGMSDDIPAKIGKHQPARLADGEFVVPADVVSHLGNGSTDAGAKHLYAMMDKVRSARTGRKAQGKQIKPEKYMPA